MARLAVALILAALLIALSSAQILEAANRKLNGRCQPGHFMADIRKGCPVGSERIVKIENGLRDATVCCRRLACQSGVGPSSSVFTAIFLPFHRMVLISLIDMYDKSTGYWRGQGLCYDWKSIDKAGPDSGAYSLYRSTCPEDFDSATGVNPSYCYSPKSPNPRESHLYGKCEMVSFQGRKQFFCPRSY